MSANNRPADQGDLFAGDPTVGRGRPGRLERKVTASIKEARKQHQLNALDEGVAQLAIEAARACDVAARIGGPNLPYAIQAAGRELRETLTCLGLTPAARGGSGDALDKLIEQWATPTVGDAANT